MTGMERNGSEWKGAEGLFCQKGGDLGLDLVCDVFESV